MAIGPDNDQRFYAFSEAYARIAIVDFLNENAFRRRLDSQAHRSSGVPLKITVQVQSITPTKSHSLVCQMIAYNFEASLSNQSSISSSLRTSFSASLSAAVRNPKPFFSSTLPPSWLGLAAFFFFGVASTGRSVAHAPASSLSSSS
jgi:hypothetical protein